MITTSVCAHSKPRKVGVDHEGAGTILAFWCPECGALNRTMTNWKYKDYGWDLPSSNGERNDRLLDFVQSLLDPDRNGYAVPPHIRDEARKALGMRPVEALRNKP